MLGPLALSCFCVFAQEQQQDTIATQQLDEVVVSDSRFALKRENSGKTVIKIDAKELERNQGRSVADIIGTKSGIVVNGNLSNAGQNISVFARGGNNRQVLVIIDGVQVSDPSAPNAEYDLRLLNTAQIERIEILKGASSTLYGNAAATAVINITTKKASKEGISLDIASSVGTNQSADDQEYNASDFTNTVTVQAKVDKLSILASGGHQFTDGLSAALGEEPDAFSRLDGNVKVGYQFSDAFQVTASAFYNKIDAEFDNGFPIEDADFSFDSEQSRFGVASSYAYNNGSINVNAVFNQVTRSFQSSFPSAFDSESFVLDVFNKYNFNDSFYTIVGVNLIENTTLFLEEQQTTTTDPYVNAVYVSDFGLNVNAGARLNNHSEYGSNLIYNLNPSYVIKSREGYLKFFGSYATSFIAPNLSQLFGPFGANPNLDPEENTTIEVGAEYRPSSKVRFSALYFNRKEEGFINFITDPVTFAGEFQNVTEDRTFNGLEFEAAIVLLSGLDFSANYTLTNREGDELAARIPKSILNAALSYTLSKDTQFGLSYQYQSERADVFFDPATFVSSPVTLESFGLLNATVSHRFCERIKVFGAFENIGNTEYTQILGFTTRGRNVRLGLQLQF